MSYPQEMKIRAAMDEKREFGPGRSRSPGGFPLFLWLIFSTSILVWGLPLVIAPLSGDEAYYALGGRTVFHGGSLYTDFWDIKPPLVYLIHVPLAPFMEDSVVLRSFYLTVAVLTVGTVY